MASYLQTCTLAFSFLLLLVSCGAAATIPLYFNTTLVSNCYTSIGSNCSLINPVFWNGTAPSSPSDAVFVIYNDTNPVTLYLTNTTLNIASINISGLVTLEIHAGSLLEVKNFVLGQGASVVVNTISTLFINGSSSLSNSTLLLNDVSTYEQIGGWLYTNSSSITATTNATLALASAQISGDLFLDSSSSFSATYINFTTSQTIHAATSLRQAYMKSVALNFTNGATIDNLTAIASVVSVEGTMVGTTILVQPDGLLEVFGDLRVINLTATASVSVYGNLIATSAKTTATFTVYGTAQVTNFTVAGGTTTAELGLTSDYLRVDGGSTLQVFSSFAVSSVLNVTNSSSLILQSVQGIINSTSLGKGSIYANTSMITLNTSYILPNAQLTLDGVCTITIPTVYVYNLQFGSSANVHFILSSGIKLDQSGNFPISLLLTNGAMNIAGTVNVTGTIAASFITANLQGNLYAAGLYLNSSVFTVATGSTITVTTTMVVQQNSTMTSLFPTSITGSLINVGTIVIDASNPMSINGKYTQMKTAVLSLSDINRGDKAMVKVTGAANIAGSLAYTPLVIAAGEKITLPVLVTTGGITGRFNAPIRPLESYSYDNTGKNMYLVFSENSGTKLYLSWVVVVALALSFIL